LASSRVIRAALLGLDGFTALTAVGGGLALATGLEGNRFPRDLLRGTPFRSYVVPGLILAGVVGGSAAVAAAATLRDPRPGAWASALAGAVLMGWIAAEVLIVRAPEARSWVEAAYFATGLLMAGLGVASGRAGERLPPPARPWRRWPA
jgi:hypothetical protein